MECYRFITSCPSLALCTKQKNKPQNNPTGDIEQPVGGGAVTPGSDLQSRSSKNANSLGAGSTATLPNEKRSGFRKWWSSTSRKKGSGTLHKFSNSSSPHTKETEVTSSNQENYQTDLGASPSARRVRKAKSNGSTSSSSASNSAPTLQPSSVKHLVADGNEDEDIAPSLPPPMQIVGNKLSLDSTSQKSSPLRNAAPSAKGKSSGSGDSPNKEVWQKRTSDSKKDRPSSSNSSGVAPLNDSHGDPEKSIVNGDLPSQLDSPQKGPPGDAGDPNLLKRSYVLMELLETEKEYVTDLATVVEGYMPRVLELGLPPPDQGKERVIFGNIAQIYEWHRDTFLKELNKCKDDPDYLGKLFKRYERRLHMYVVYCQNKPLSEYLVLKYKQPYFTDIQSQVGTKLDVTDFLIKPVQRIMKYQLLLKDFLKFTERAQLNCDDLKAAVQVMHVVPKLANDMMMVARMSGYTGRIAAQGKLLLQDTFLVRDGSNSHEKERKVFFFEQSVIFSELVDKRVEERGFVYKTSIKNSDLILGEMQSSECRFSLSKRSCDETHELCAVDAKTKETWLEAVKQQLNNQMDFLNALQAPIHYQRQQLESVNHNGNNNNNNNNNNSNTNSNNRSRTTGERQFLSTFKPTIHLNSKPGGELVTPDDEKSSRDVTAARHMTSSPPQSKQESTTAARPSKALPQSTLENIEISSSRSATPSPVRPLSMPESRLRGESPDMKLELNLQDSNTDNSPQNSFTRCKNLQPRPASAVGHEGAHTLSFGRVTSLSNPSTPVRSVVHSHQSAPDLASTQSFWLSPQSPANILSSTSKFTYPNSPNTSAASEPSTPMSESPAAQQQDPQTKSPVSTVRAVKDYTAQQEDEISVKQGDALDIIATNAQGMCLVFRPATDDSPPAEGWLPGVVLGRPVINAAANRRGRSTPRSVKRSRKNQGSNSLSRPLARMLRKSKSSDKLLESSSSSTGGDQSCSLTLPNRTSHTSLGTGLTAR